MDAEERERVGAEVRRPSSGSGAPVSLLVRSYPHAETSPTCTRPQPTDSRPRLYCALSPRCSR